MRRSVMVLAAVGILAVLAAVAVGAYAVYNLNSLIARNQARIVKLIADALERPVQVDKVTARAGWGISIEISGLKVGDDPAFSQQPFLTAPTTTLRVALFPILRGHVRVHALTLVNPVVHLLEDAKGNLNVDTIGGPPNSTSPVSPLIATFFVGSLEVEDGALDYNQAGQQGAPISIQQISGTIDDFGLLGRFDADLKFAFLNDRPNCALTGKVGPLLHHRMLETASIPIDLTFKADPLVIDQLKNLVDIGASIPEKLSMPDAAAFSGSLKGKIDSAAFDISAELTSASVKYSTDFVKPQKVPANVEATGEIGLVSNTLKLNAVKVKLGDLNADLSQLSFPDNGPSQLHIDTNTFSLADVAGSLPALTSYRIAGKGEVHGTFVFAEFPFSSQGTLKLTQASIATSNSSIPGVSNLDTSIVIKDKNITLTPATFSIGGAKATAQGVVDSFSPLHATYQFSADSVRPAAFIANRPSAEVLNNLRIAGNATGAFDAPLLSARITSSSGMFAAIAYTNLDVTGGYAGGRFTFNPLKAQVFSGAVTINGNASMRGTPQFSATTQMNGIDVYAALQALDPKVPHRLRGSLSGNVKLAGAGKNWNAISPTLNGSGSLALRDGKVAGLNIVAIAINKIAAAPGVSQIINATFMSDHQGMLADPDTELKDARMTFVLANERITTHDLTVRSSDYGINGDGWFDLDHNISMSLDIQLTFGLSVTLPIYVRGQAPVVLVVPDIPKLAERIALGAISVPGKIIQGGVSGLNSLIGGGSSGSGGSSIPNPLDKLKGWLP